MAANLQMECLMHRARMAVSGESAATHALIKLSPGDSGVPRSLCLNLALVIDVSGSMYERDGTGMTRLQRVQEAAAGAVTKLRPEDTVALVGFGKTAQVVLPSTAMACRALIEESLRQIEQWTIDPQGTALDQGMALGIAEIAKHAAPDRLDQVIVLTDGEASGEALCHNLARQAARQRIRLTLMGVGTEWNSSLLQDLAHLSGGQWYYIDANQAEDMRRIFLEEFTFLTTLGFQKARLRLKSVKDVLIKRVRRVSPDIVDLSLTDEGERQWGASLGLLRSNKAVRYLVDLTLPIRPDGRYVIAQGEVHYCLPGKEEESTGWISLEMLYTAAGHGYINAEVARHIDEVHIFELNGQLQRALAADNRDDVYQLAKTIFQQGERLGRWATRKTNLARQVFMN